MSFHPLETSNTPLESPHHGGEEEMKRGREGEKTTTRFSYSILVVTARIEKQRAGAHNPRDHAERVPLVQRNTAAKTAPAELPGVPRTSTRKNAVFSPKNGQKQVGGPVHVTLMFFSSLLRSA